MKSSEKNDLWVSFLENHEADFKEYLGYGKEEIEEIGIEKFFNFMGWSKEDDLVSYKTDRLHVLPCVQCKKEFAVFETNYGLCDNCQKGYDLDEFAKFTDSVRSDQGEKAVTEILGAFYSSEDYRDCFKIKPADTPEFSWVSLSNKSWKVVPLQELLKVLKEAELDNTEYRYQIVLHDQSFYSKNEKTIFKNSEVAEELFEKYPNIFQHKNN